MSSIPSEQFVLRSRIPELDTLRGIAVLLVLFFHGFNLTPIHVARPAKVVGWFLGATAGGWMGVNLFFVLSGFLITGILLNTRSAPHYYREFYRRRALRILPAYYLILAVLLLVTRLGMANRNVGWPFLGLSFVYLANVTDLFGVASQYTVLWSLAVEEHFYLLWPTAVRWLTRRGLTIACIVLVAGCPALRAFYYLRGYEYGAGYTWLTADGLACGALLAILVRGALGSRRGLMLFAAGTAVLALAVFVGGLPYGIYLSRTLAGGAFRYTFLNLAFTAVVAGALAVSATRFASLLRIGWLKFFGDISYGLYLVHMLAFDVVDHFGARLLPSIYSTPQGFLTVCLRFLVGSGFSITLAYGSRWYFEERFLRLREKRESIPTATLPKAAEEVAAAS
jgi:peptidoglycan/LPS O-acetylase OafA/YrhL